jgi:hypothetical protein
VDLPHGGVTSTTLGVVALNRPTAVLTLAALVFAALPQTASAAPVAEAAHGLCRGVQAGSSEAYDIHAINMGCRSTRNKLTRWLRRGSLPRGSYGWFCGSAGGGKRLCSVGNGNAPHFTFRLRKRRCSGYIKLGARTYVFYRSRVGCSAARRAVRRLYASGGDEGEPPGFRCTSGSGFRQGAYCSAGGGRQVFGWHPLD